MFCVALPLVLIQFLSNEQHWVWGQTDDSTCRNFVSQACMGRQEDEHYLACGACSIEWTWL